jgi:hypothetical protein
MQFQRAPKAVGDVASAWRLAGRYFRGELSMDVLMASPPFRVTEFGE